MSEQKTPASNTSSYQPPESVYESATKEDFEAIFSKLEALRKYGVVHRGVHFLTPDEIRKADLNRSQDREIEKITNYIHAEGFHLMPRSGWDVLNEQQARLILKKLLHDDMAYSSHDVYNYRRPENVEEVKTLVDDFFSLFESSSTLYLSNNFYYGPLKGTDGASGWDPLTDATFDSGVIAADPQKIAYIWFDDED